MSDNDLIRRGDALAAAVGNRDLGFKAAQQMVDAIAALPAAPLPAVTVDAVTYGTGIMQDGKRIDPQDFFVAKMVQEARDQAFREAAKAAGDAAVEVLMRHFPDANVLMQQARRQSVAVPVMRLIGTPHPEVAKDDG